MRDIYVKLESRKESIGGRRTDKDFKMGIELGSPWALYVGTLTTRLLAPTPSETFDTNENHIPNFWLAVLDIKEIKTKYNLLSL